MALKSGNGWIAIKRGRVVETGESAFEIKARLLVKKQLRKSAGKSLKKGARKALKAK